MALLLSACGMPVETEEKAVAIAKDYIQANFDLAGNSINDYRVKVWDERQGADPLFSVYFVHKNRYDAYANEHGEIVDAYAPVPPESIMIDVYSRNGRIDASTNYDP